VFEYLFYTPCKTRLFPRCDSKTSQTLILTYYQPVSKCLLSPSQFDACIGDLVRCVALAKLAYGERHVKLAQAHIQLAEAYIQFKGTFV